MGYGPRLGQGPAQAAPYLVDATSTITGKPATATYGNGVSTVWGYDDRPRTSGAFGPDRLETTEVASATGGVLSDRDYTWNVLGDLESVYDPLQRLSAMYTYDGLRRVKTSSVSSGTQTYVGSYDYDPLGNLLTKEGAVQEYGQASLAGSCAATSSSLPHALTRRTDPAQTVRDPYCYDAAGRLLTSQRTADNSIRRYAYFARGKVSRLEDRVWLSRYAYDGDGARVWRSETGGTPSVEETVPFDTYRESGPGCEVTYYVGAKAIARRELARPGGSTACASSSGALVWFADDHLGGTTLLTDQAGAQVPFSTSHYLPFGSLLTAAPYGSTPQQAVLSGGRLFTSKRRDATGLYDFGARPYDPVTGRFTQPDDLRIGGSPQTADPYAYVRNGPLRLVDPTGHQPAGLEQTIPVPDPVAGFVDRPVIPSLPSEWAEYSTPASRAIAFEGLSKPPLISARGNKMFPIATYGDFLEFREELNWSGGNVDARMELQQFGMETMANKNLPGFKGSAIALGVVYSAAEMAAASAAAGELGALTPGPAREMIAQIKDRIGLIPAGARTRVVESWLNQVKAANSGWEFTVVPGTAGQAGTTFMPSQIGVPMIEVESTGAVWYGQWTVDVAAGGIGRGEGLYLVR